MPRANLLTSEVRLRFLGNRQADVHEFLMACVK